MKTREKINGREYPITYEVNEAGELEEVIQYGKGPEEKDPIWVVYVAVIAVALLTGIILYEIYLM